MSNTQGKCIPASAFTKVELTSPDAAREAANFKLKIEFVGIPGDALWDNLSLAPGGTEYQVTFYASSLLPVTPPQTDKWVLNATPVKADIVGGTSLYTAEYTVPGNALKGGMYEVSGLVLFFYKTGGTQVAGIACSAGDALMMVTK